MFSKPSTKSKLVINAILLVFGAVLYGGLWYGISYVSDIVVAERSKFEEAENITVRANQTEKILLETEEARNRVNGFILSDDEVVGFIESLESLAKDIGLEETTEAVSDTAYPGFDAKKWNGLQIVLSVRGSWSRVYQFLSLLENLPYQTTLLRVVIEKAGGAEGLESPGAEWKGDFTIQVLKHK